MLPAILVLLAMAAAAVLVWVRRSLPPALTLLALAAVWLPVNSRLEGAVLVAFGPEHGITLADLLVPLAIGYVVVVLRRNSVSRAR